MRKDGFDRRRAYRPGHLGSGWIWWAFQLTSRAELAGSVPNRTAPIGCAVAPLGMPLCINVAVEQMVRLHAKIPEYRTFRWL